MFTHKIKSQIFKKGRRSYVGDNIINVNVLRLHDKMDIRSELRELVSGRYMPNFDYIRRNYTFETVFDRTMYSYCCCDCGFQHEYLDYLSDTGEVNEVFDKIVQCIIDGRCPHVNDDNDEHVRETCVNAIHIAAATGTKEAVQYHATHFCDLKTSLFRVEPHALALLKNKPYCVNLYLDRFEAHAVDFPRDCLWGDRDISFYVSYATRSPESEAHIKVKRESLVELCVKKKSSELLKSILRCGIVGHPNIHTAFELAYKQNLADLQEIMIEYDRGRLLDMVPGDMPEMKHSVVAVAAILCNQPEVLDKVRMIGPNRCFRRRRTPLKADNSFITILIQICQALNRQTCLDTLLKYKDPIGNNDEDSREQNNEIKVRRLLDLFRFHKHYRHDIMTFLKAIPDVGSVMNMMLIEEKSLFGEVSMMGPLHSYFYANDDTDIECALDPEVVKIMFELGLDIDSTDSNGNSPLICFLNLECWWCNDTARKCLELLIYENPNIDLNISAVAAGFKWDNLLSSGWHVKTGNFQMDAREHSLFGHNEKHDYALNFTAPLLMECGFPVSRDILQKALDKDTLPVEELAYIRTYLDTPRSLAFSCRDALRKKLKGRSLHKFMESSIIPNNIKDFILLKYMLHCIK